MKQREQGECRRVMIQDREPRGSRTRLGTIVVRIARLRSDHYDHHRGLSKMYIRSSNSSHSAWSRPRRLRAMSRAHLGSAFLEGGREIDCRLLPILLMGLIRVQSVVEEMLSDGMGRRADWRGYAAMHRQLWTGVRPLAHVGVRSGLLGPEHALCPGFPSQLTQTGTAETSVSSSISLCTSASASAPASASSAPSAASLPRLNFLTRSTHSLKSSTPFRLVTSSFFPNLLKNITNSAGRVLARP